MPADPELPARSRWAGWMGAALIALAAWAAYQRSFSIPFVFDDHAAIETNPSIARLWPMAPALSPPSDGRAVTNRPVVNLSFAINRAMGGFAVRGYHATNLAIHVVAGLALFAVLRRTLRLPALAKPFGEAAFPLALSSALIWTVHPLQTESVSFIVQRTESLVGCWYLLVLYCFVRGLDSRLPAVWQALAVIVCLLGMATKEVMVSAPLMVLVYDRTFVSGTFQAAWARHGKLHAALAATWLLLLYLVSTGHGTRSLGADFDPAATTGRTC